MRQAPVDGDVLSSDQRTRSAAAYEAARMILSEDPSPDDVITVADYIVSGRRTSHIKVGPSEELVQQVVERVAKGVTTSLNELDNGPGYVPPVGGDEVDAEPGSGKSP